MATLPTDGQSNWGDPLNAVINSQGVSISSNTTSIANHAANSPADPHGDRAYASGLVSPITTGVNGPNGYVKTNGSGFIPAALINGSAATGGLYSTVFDAVTMYGAVAGNGLDQSVAIQNALNACSAVGGGIVFLGQGTFSLSNYLIMPSNVWLMMTPQTVLQRISGSSNPAYMITNVIFSTGAVGSNVKITGGYIDSYGSAHLTSACTNIFLWQASNAWVEDVRTNTPSGAGPAIEVNGCSNVWITNCLFSGTSGSGVTVPAIRINSSSTSTSPSGLPGGSYNNKTAAGVYITNCAASGSSGTFGSLVGSDKVYASAATHNYITISGSSTQYAMTNGSVYPNTASWNNSDWGNNGFFESGWIAASYSNGWTTGSGLALKYRYATGNCIEFQGLVSCPSSGASGQTITTITNPLLQPAVSQQGSSTVHGAASGAAWANYTTGGVFSVNGISSLFSTGALFTCNFRFPLSN